MAMAMRFLSASTERALHALLRRTTVSHFSSQQQQLSPPFPDLINDVSRILSDHRSPHHDLEHSLSGFSPHISTELVEQVLKRCKNLGFSAHRFFLWAKTIPQFHHSAISYRILIDILGSSKNFALLWDFVREMKDFHSSELNQEIFWIIFRAYSKANLPEDAVRAFGRMTEFGVRPNEDDINKLLYVLCKRKHAKHAQEFLDKAKVELGFEPSAKSYSILMRGWGDIGEAKEAQKVFGEMSDRGCKIDIQAYNSLLDAVCKSGDVVTAYKMYQEMRSKGVEPDAHTYSIFISAYCKNNDIHSVFRVLDKTKRLNLVPNVFTYNCIIKTLCKNDKIEEVYELLDEMIKRGANPDSWSYNSIQAYHCDHGEVNKSLRLLSRMKKDNCMPDRHSYNMALKLLIRIGRFDRAEEVWNSMEKVGFYPSVSTYSVMVHGFSKKKSKLEEACKYFEMMVDEGIPPYAATVEMLHKLLLGQGQSDLVEILAGKMERSTSGTINELAAIMRGGVKKQKSEGTDIENNDFESE